MTPVMARPCMYRHNPAILTILLPPMAIIAIQEPGAPVQRPATFEEPHAMLMACHQRVLRMCTLLEKLYQHAALHGADAQARQAAADVMRYFDLAGPEHHEDEERHLFPRMLFSADTRQTALARTLHEQHLHMSTLWQQLRPLLHAVVEGDAQRLLADAPLVNEWATLYRAHVALEEDHAYPDAFALMTAEDIRHMGAEMALRRSPGSRQA